MKKAGTGKLTDPGIDESEIYQVYLSTGNGILP